MGNTAATFYRSRASVDVDRKVFAVIGGVGAFCALTVFAEMCEKLGGSTSPNWSAIRLMGPQIWLPLKTKEDHNIAIIILIFSIMYAASCGLLIYGGWNRVKDLSLTWKLNECGVLVYQIIAALITAPSFSAVDSVLLVLDTVLGIVALAYTRIAETTWQDDAPAGEEEQQRQPSVEPPVQDISEEPEPGSLSQQARRSLEAIAGPSAEPGPSGVPRLARAAGELQLHEINGDSDSLDDVAAVMEPPPPPPRPVVSPRRKKSSARTTHATVHAAPEDLQEISVAADPERTLGSISEESVSDISRGSPPPTARTPPRHTAATEESSETKLEGSPQGVSTTAEPEASTEQPVLPEAPVPKEASPKTAQSQFLQQMLAAPAEAFYVRPRLPSGTSQVPAEGESRRQQPVPAAEIEPSQETSGAAESCTADTEATARPTTDTVVTSLPMASAESPSSVEMQPPQLATPEDTVVAAADSPARGAEAQGATETADDRATGAEDSTGVRESAHL